MHPDVIWAAGFFDGEGCTYFSSRDKNVRINLGQIDRRPLDRFAKAVGYGNVTGPYKHGNGNGKWKDFYMWQCYSKKAVAVMDVLWPYLSDPKKEQWIKKTQEVRDARAS